MEYVMAKELAKQYDPKEVEDRTYKFWLDSNYFHAVPDPEKKPYTIVIPPPNITVMLLTTHFRIYSSASVVCRATILSGFPEQTMRQ